MKQIAWQVRFLTIGAAVFLLGACDVDQVDDGEMPEIDVEAEEGELPEYDVDAPEVDVRSDTDTVIVEHPEVDIQPAEED